MMETAFDYIQICKYYLHIGCLLLFLVELMLLNTLASGWFWRFLQKKTAVFGCLTNALAPLPIALESCSTAQTDRPV